MGRLVIKTISCQALRELSQQQPVEVIDVRTLEEFVGGHVPGAILAPLDMLDPRQIMQGRDGDTNEPLYLICEVGARSAHACIAFMTCGYPNVVNVEGGTSAWRDAGFPVVRET